MESFYDWGSINLNNKEKLIQDNYSKVNQISARCMRVIVAILALAFVYCYFGTDMDESVLIVFFASAIFIALIPTLIINILKFDHAPVTKHIVIICVCLIATLMLTLLSTYAYPIMLFPILLASLYYNQTLVDRVENVDVQWNVDRRVFTGTWKEPGDRTFFKRVESIPTQTYPTSRFVEKSNELSLSSLNVSYDFKRLNVKRYVERLKIAFYMTDVFRVSTVKAERGLEYPFARTCSFSLQATF